MEKNNLENTGKLSGKLISNVSILYDGGRSGSVFLQSLLDGHSQIITFPSTLLIGGLTGIHFDNFYKANADNSPEQIALNFTKDYKTAFDSSSDSTATRLNKLGENQDQKIGVDENLFIQSFVDFFDEKIEKSYSNIFNIAHLSWAYAQGKKLQHNIIILHALHTPEDKMKMYCENFPNSKHLVCIRNPIISHNSRFIHHIKRHKLNDRNTEYFHSFEHLDYPFNMTKDVLLAFKIIEKYTNFQSVRGVRNEDLHNNSEVTLSNLCKFLKIEFEPQLLESTFFGLKHWGDDTIEPRNGFSKDVSVDFNISESFFNTNDVALIEDLIEDRILHFGYSRLTLKSGVSMRRINRITKWEEISLFSILGPNSFLANLAIRSRFLGPNMHKIFIYATSLFVKKSEAKILITWVRYVNLRTKLMKSYVIENLDKPEPKFELI
jgi:hypothetical protein